ncbi:serine hydrolase domain-containing protein [Paenibacillus glucanolyticus]|uniref:serine hydrolase domain-containing protein n=1 Tax=Paenibacillus glucanolyticus TaxID=59843 RepID=UPI00128BF911|nr:serine hydrolase [Paenibacillus glucanolyticus]MPY15686.1 serine hydrolase [Paenibacillus glucanolyticus]
MNMNTVPLLPRSTPENQGISSQSIECFIASIQEKELELHSFMLVRHGHVAAEGWWKPYQADKPHMLFSLSKSFTSTAIGLLAQEGRVTLEDQVIGFFPENTPEEPSSNLSAMTIRDLLIMGTGHAQEPAIQSDIWVDDFFKQEVEHEPGTHFVYNSAATYMLSAILQKVTGITLLDYLQPRLFEPLGIHGATWESCPKGINTGGWGLKVKTEDIAKFGQLYLQKGVWEGRRLIPEDWIEEATSKQIFNGPADSTSDWTEGYGYQFWMCRHGGYRGDGAFGQFCVVLPEQDAVIAITSGLGDMQEVLDVVWEHLLPAMGPDKLPADTGAESSLAGVLQELKLDPPREEARSPIEQDITGIVYELEENEDKLHSISIRFEEDGAVMELAGEDGTNSIAFGRNEWKSGTTKLIMLEDNDYAASMTWNDQTLRLTIRLTETPFYLTTDCTFNEEGIHLAYWMNQSFQGKVVREINGKAKA